MKIIKSTSIELRSGLLLSKEILEQMNIQSCFFQYQYERYPDGFIYGFEFVENEGILYLSSGLLKYHGNYYFSPDSLNITEFLNQYDEECLNYTRYSVLAFVQSDKLIESEGISSECLELKLIDKKDLTVNDIILAEFQYHKGKRKWKLDSSTALEQLHAQLDDKGYYYTFLNVKYSLPNENVFSPTIYKMMRGCIEEKFLKSDADLMLLFMLSQNEIVSFEVLKNWFNVNGITVDMNDRKLIVKAFLNYMERHTTSQISTNLISKPVKSGTKSDDFGI